MKLLMLKGLPGSGKSTHARKLADDGWVRVNKDDIRSMLNNGKWSKPNEKYVLQLRDHIICESLEAGKSVAVDDTNFANTHQTRLRELTERYGATFETKFFDVPLEECIRRDLIRPNSVGEKVIKQMYRQFLEPTPEQYKPLADKPQAILVDIDGTLAHFGGGRLPYDWDRVGEDTLDNAVATVIDHFWDTYSVILLSGRDSVCRAKTEQWLEDNDVNYSALLMRPEGDKRKDTVIKRELFDKHIRDSYQVLFVIDDRWAVCQMWLQMGLKVLNVSGLDRGEF